MPYPERVNALSKETSPYLLQHAHNPVDWYPWSEEALSKAREEDKPILLSIGYSACHWCHVMERESFENKEIADLMNRYFVSIKVDREERPDLDSIYMSAVQMMTGRGGWPLTVFLTPAQVPFYGGTYFPPADRHGMPGFPRILLGVARAYRERKATLQNDAERILQAMRNIHRHAAGKRKVTFSILDSGAEALAAGFDAENGGFGTAPKFPPSMALDFLMRTHNRTGRREPLEMAETTLRRMAAGGIYDQLGGGFHRYSVDNRWLVPHFEKMLYDNALLARAYLNAFLLTGDASYRRTAEETLDYVIREMTSPSGGFYSSQDADSDGEEGKFYVWTREEILTTLGQQDGDMFCRLYDVTEEGNFEGRNILNVKAAPRDILKSTGLSEAGSFVRIQGCRQTLLNKRNKRTTPGRDEKILTAWNALMMKSFAEAAVGLGRLDYRKAAVRNASFILTRLMSGDRLLRCYKDGRARFNAYLEDYAYLIDGFLSVYEATFDLAWLHQAVRLAEVLVSRFGDPDGFGFFLTSNDHEGLIERPKDFYDGAMPSGNSVAVQALLRLWKFTDDEGWSRWAQAILEGMADAMARHPAGFSNLLCAADFLLCEVKEIAVIGDPENADTQDLLEVVFHRYLPNKVVACGLEGGLPLLGDRPQAAGKPTVYICRGYTCDAPVTDSRELSSRLEKG